MSGTHLSNFYELCNGRHDIYYPRKPLEAKPNLNFTVAADLPEAVFMDSTGRPSSTGSKSTKCKGDKGSEILDILHDIQSGHQQSELSKHKLDLMEQMELWKAKEKHWKVKEKARKEREEERRNIEHVFEVQWKAKEDGCKENEEEHKAHEHLLNEWECIQLNIWQLSDVLSIETNELINHDMQSDIIALTNRKKLHKLNLN